MEFDNDNFWNSINTACIPNLSREHAWINGKVNLKNVLYTRKFL